MKKQTSIFLPLLAIFCLECSPPNGVAGHVNLPPKADSTDAAYVSGELLYPLDNKPTPECHASTIVETPDGLVASFFAGTYESHPDVGIWVSRMVDGKWTWPEEVADGVQNDTLRYPCWNPVLFQPEGGDLMLFYKVGPSPQTWWGMVITSKDNGNTWSEPRKLGEDPKVGHLLGPVKNKPIQLADGTIINPTSIEYPKNDGEDQDWRVYFEISKDLGHTWEVVGPINDGLEFDAIQPSILTYPDGKLQVVCRSRQDVLVQSWSEDQGRTWSKMTAMELPNPNSGTDAVTLQDGRQLLVYNHSTKRGEEPKDRNILNVALSDDGNTWKPVMTLENEPIEDGYAYPAVIQSADGMVHITYTYNRRSVKHVVLDPQRL
ncbi:sialidase family protein [Parapedobacter indicus]|uniref:Predicted neuraminidase (Sialidase) n=1 Tax=Parapedobacter indicus TaxID=1477437 RepID=A0A1I3RQ60_9SPHI|nr:sialidase family protein [Parapedobacter indicus]PPL00031.1 putative neuraminidase [Parapedobacter indicus]SFJ48455.1 Predicted neuraminidase (sialidase) [Parapedobacter indicus]